MNIKLTQQETKINSYLFSKNNSHIHWEELAQFFKNPQSVKLSSIRKAVSELKKKYLQNNQMVPFIVQFSSLYTDNKTDIPQVIINVPTQKLVQVKKTLGGNTIILDGKACLNPAQIDFELDFNSRRVKTKYGSYQLNYREWDVFKYIHSKAGKLIAISELRDRVVYPQFGSKLPPRWFNSIQQIVNNMRGQIPELKNRLLTVKGQETTYLFQ